MLTRLKVALSAQAVAGVFWGATIQPWKLPPGARLAILAGVLLFQSWLLIRWCAGSGVPRRRSAVAD